MDDFTVRMILEWIYKNKELLAAQAEARGMQKTVKNLQADIKQGFNQALAHADKFAAGLVSAGKKLMLVGGLGLAAFGALAVKVGQAGDKWDDYRDNIETVVKDQNRVNELLDYTSKASFELPFPKDDIQEAIKLMTVFGYKPEEWMAAFGNAALVANTSMSSIAEAFGRAKATGGQSLRALTGQLAITDDQLKAMGWSGAETDVAGFEGALKKLIETRFGGRLEKEMGEAGTALQNFKNMFSWFASTVGSEMLREIAPDLVNLRAKFVELYESGKLKEWAHQVAQGFKAVWQGVKKAAEAIWKVLKPVVNFFKEHPQMLKWAVAALAVGSAASFLGGGIMALTGKVWQLGRGLAGGLGRLRQFGAGVKGLLTNVRSAGGLSGLLAGKGGVLGGVGQIAGGLGGKLSGMGGLGGKIGGLLGGGGAAAGGAGGIAATLSAALPIIGAVIAAAALFATAWKKNFSGIREATKTAFQPLGDIVNQLAGLPKGAGGALKSLGGIFKETWQGLARVAAPIFNFLIKSMTAPFRILKAIAAPIINGIKKALEAFGIIGKGSATGIKDAFEAVGKVFDWLFTSLGKIIDFIIEPIVWGIDQIVKGIQWLTKTLGLNKEGVSKFGKNLKAEWEAIGKAVKWVAGFVWLIWSKVIGAIVEWFKGLVEKVKGPVQAIGGFFKGLWDGIVKGAAAAWTWIKSKLIDPLVKGFEWLWKNVLKPIADFFGNLFKPLVDGVKAVFKWVGDLLAKAPGWLVKTLGVSEDDLARLKDWVEGAEKYGPQKPAALPSEQGTGVTPPGADAQAAADAAAASAGSSSGGGPTINNYITHNHLAPGAINILSNKIEEIRRILKEIFESEALEQHA